MWREKDAGKKIAGKRRREEGVILDLSPRLGEDDRPALVGACRDQEGISTYER
jgi:hypothetical protein